MTFAATSTKTVVRGGVVVRHELIERLNRAGRVIEVTGPDEIPLFVRQAFLLATTGRPGPALLDVPKDVLQAEMSWSWPSDTEVAASLPGYKPTINGHPRMIKEAARVAR